MYIEEYLELLSNFDIDSKDIKLINSLNAQSKKQIALTDRQHNLLKEKLLEYKEKFLNAGYSNLEDDLNNLRLPYRIIDRTKKIFVVEKESYDLFGISKRTMLAIKFPYTSKMIKHITFIKSLQDRKEYDSKTKTHFLSFTEKNIFLLIDRLKDCNFEVQKELYDMYLKIKDFINDQENYVPGIYNYKIKNVSDKTLSFAKNTLGNPSIDNLALYYDRKDIFGLCNFDSKELEISLTNLNSLAKNIAKHDEKIFFISASKYSYDALFTALDQLQRFPLLIVLKKNFEYLQLVEIYETIKNKINNTEISVLFRLENTNNNALQFNKIIQEHNLNNPVTSQTKIVILNHEKIPKPLLNTNWISETTLLMESLRYSKIVSAYHNKSNLILHYDEQPSTWISQKLIHI